MSMPNHISSGTEKLSDFSSLELQRAQGLSVVLGDSIVNISLGKEDHIGKDQVIVSQNTLQQLGGNLETAGTMLYLNGVSNVLVNNQFSSKLLLTAMIDRYSREPYTLKKTLGSINNSSVYSVFTQFFMLAFVNPGAVSFEVQEILKQKLSLGGQEVTVRDFVGSMLSEIAKHDLIKEYVHGQFSQESVPYRKLLNNTLSMLEKNGVIDQLKELEAKRKRELSQRNKQFEEKDKKNNPTKKEIQEREIPPFSPEYQPQDSLKQENNESTITVLGSFEPPVTGYLKEYSMQIFSGLKWSLSMNDLKSYEVSNDQATYIYSATMPRGIHALVVPYGYEVCSVSSGAELFVNECGDFFINSGGGKVSVGFSKTNRSSSDNYLHNQQLFTIKSGSLIDDFLQKLSHLSPQQKLSAVADFIKNKFYTTEYQGSFVQRSSHADEYFETLFGSEKMECYSANTLFVALARKLGFEAKLSLGFHTKFVYQGKSYITQNDGHARSEIKIGNQWQIMDVTPINNNENREQSEENREEKNDNILEKPSQEELDELKRQIIEDSEEIPYDLKEIMNDVGLQEALQFEEMIKKVSSDAEQIAKNLKDFLRTYIIEIQKKIVDTRKVTPKIYADKMLKTIPELVQGTTDALNKLLQKPKIYTKDISEEIQKYELPDQLKINFVVDLSSSMDSTKKKEVVEHLIMLRCAFKMLYSFLKEVKMEVLLDVYCFGSDYEKNIGGLTLNNDKKTKLEIIKLIKYIQQRDLGGNEEKRLYSAIIREQEHEKKDLSIKKLGFTFTDEETFVPDDIAKLLNLLKRDYDLPFVSVNVGGSKTIGGSGYEKSVKSGEGFTNALIEMLKKIIKG